MKRNSALGLVGIAVSLALSASPGAAQQPSVAALPPAWVPPPPAQYSATQITAVHAGRLFDPRSGTLRANQIIVMRGDRIVDVGPDIPIPTGAHIIDLSRATVLPGLIDTHLHTMTGNPLTAPGGPGIGPQGPGPTGFAQPIPHHTLAALVNAQRDLDAGFTTVVDLMSHGGWYGTVDLKNAIRSGLVRGPRMQVAGPGMINASPTPSPKIPLLDREPISALGRRRQRLDRRPPCVRRLASHREFSIRKPAGGRMLPCHDEVEDACSGPPRFPERRGCRRRAERQTSHRRP